MSIGSLIESTRIKALEEWEQNVAERIYVATIASEILTRKAGKYAERPADVFDVIRLAEYLLYGDDE